MYLSGVPKKQGLYWVKEKLGWDGYNEPKLCRLGKRFSPNDSEGVLCWWAVENNKNDHFFLAAGNDLYWDIRVVVPKEYECLRRIDEVNEKQEDIE